MPNSWQQPEDTEPGGATWHKVADPSTGWFDSKTSGWTADSFSTGASGMDVDFSPVIFAGTRCVRVWVAQAGTQSAVYSRPSGDTRISTDPDNSGEYSHSILNAEDDGILAEIWLSTDYRAQFSVNNTGTDLYVAYPRDYQL